SDMTNTKNLAAELLKKFMPLNRKTSKEIFCFKSSKQLNQSIVHTKHKKINIKLATKQRLILLRPQFPWKTFNKKSIIEPRDLTYNNQQALNKLQSRTGFANSFFYNEQEKKIIQKALITPVINFLESESYKQPNPVKENLIKITIKPGWVYLQDTRHQTVLGQEQFGQLIKNDKKIIKPGEICFTDVSFDQHPVYYECLSVKKISVQNNKYISKKNTILQKQSRFITIYEKYKNLSSSVSLGLTQVKKNASIFSEARLTQVKKQVT